MGQGVSRRTFLKLSCSAGAAATISPSIAQVMSWAKDLKLEGSTEFVPSFCEMCTSRCPIQAKVVDNQGVFITGNPNWAPTGGTVCARGGSGFSQLYDPQRLQKPLIRVGERGEGKWREASWEEAYDYIAGKMKGIKEKFGPESMAFACRKGPHMAYLYTLAKAYGSPNTFNHESTCPMARTVALEATLGTADVGIDYGNVRYLITLGRNYFEGLHVAQARGVMNAIGKGAKMVSLDPRFSLTSAKAHEWYPIKPGTDLAFVLAVIHVLIRDQLYDKDFVSHYTSGFEALKDSVPKYTPAWAEKETEVKAADIERIARELAAARPKAVIDWGWRTQYTPEEFELRRAIVIANMLLGNLEIPGGTFFAKSPKFINGMLEEEAVPGIKGPKLPPFPAPGKPRIDGAAVKGHPNSMVPAIDGVVQAVPEAILTEQPYGIKGWFVFRYNPVTTIPGTERVLQAIKKLDLLVACDIYMSDTAWYADVVLPESTYLERDEGFNDYSGASPAFTLRQQVVKPIYNTRAHWQIMKDIAERMSLGAYFPWKDIEDLRLMQMGGNGDMLKMGKEKGIVTFGMKPLFLRDPKSVEEFVKKFPQAQRLVNEKGIIDKPLAHLKTKSKKIELLSSEAEELFGRGLPVYHPVKLAEKNEYYFIQGKTALHTNGHTHNVPWLYDLFSENRLWIHPRTAAKYGMANGDTAEMTSSLGKQKVKVLLTEGIRPDTVFTYFGFGRLSPGLKRAYKRGLNSNILIPAVTAPVAGTMVQTRGVSVKKA